jgi:hypothetical protein
MISFSARLLCPFKNNAMFQRKLKRGIEKAFNIEIRRKSTKFINEAINFEKEIIFIAIPKTGTTSIRTQLHQSGRAMIWNPHLDINQIRSLIYVYLLQNEINTNRSFPNSNSKSDIQLRQKAEEIFMSFFKFSAVRNPWARAVSLYNRREGVQVKDKMSFEKFCENHFYASDTCKQPTLHKNQLDWLTSHGGQNLMDYVYKVEEYEKAIEEIVSRTNGRLVLENVKRNVNPESLSNEYRNLYNEKTRKIIAKHFEKDIDHFKYTF